MIKGVRKPCSLAHDISSDLVLLISYEKNNNMRCQQDSINRVLGYRYVSWSRESKHSPNLPSWDTLAFSFSTSNKWARSALKGRCEGSGAGDQEGLKAVPTTFS